MTEPETNDQPAAEATNAKTASNPPPSAGATADATVEFAEPELAKSEASKSETPDPLEVAKGEAAKYREQLLRTAADFDNFRKRSRREAEEAQRRGIEKALKELLPVFDNLERASSVAATAPDVKSVADGLSMIGRQFTSTLEKLGIKRIAAVGQAFDPSLHEAIQHVDSADHPAGVIAVEVQAGYMLGDYLLRAALVAVSKGPPAAPAEAPATEGEGAKGDPPPEA